MAVRPAASGHWPDFFCPLQRCQGTRVNTQVMLPDGSGMTLNALEQFVPLRAHG